MKLKVNKIHSAELRSFINLVLKISDAAYLVVEDGKLVTKMYDDQKSAVIVNEVPIETCMEFDKLPDDPIRLGFYSGSPSKLLKYLDLFDIDGLSAVIEATDSLIEGCHYATQINLSDGRLKMSLTCQNSSIPFIYLPKDKEPMVFDKSSAKYSFFISKEMLDKVSKLVGFANEDSDLIEIFSDADGVHFRKKDLFDLIVSEKVKATNPPKNLFKKFILRIPSDNYEVFMFDNKILFYATDSEFRLAVNLAIVD